MQSVNPIAFSCYFSGFEYYQVLVDYFHTIMDVNKLVYNLFHNAGSIYDTVTDLIDLFRYGDSGQRYYWKTIGNSVGHLLKQISYKPKDFDPYNGPKKPVTPTPEPPKPTPVTPPKNNSTKNSTNTNGPKLFD